MILPGFAYARPKTVRTAIALHNASQGQAVYLAGGTDLVPRLKYRLVNPTVVIDLKGIQTLTSIIPGRRFLKIGANVTLHDLKNHPAVRENYPALYQSLDATSCETLQMRGTIAGNVLQNTRCLFYNKPDEWRKAKGYCLKMGGPACNAVKGAKMCFANYAGDNAPALITLNAEVKLSGIDGERQMPLEAIFSGKSDLPYTIKPGEILTHILIPGGKTKGDYLKLRVRGSIDYPLVGAAVSLVNERGRVAVGAVGSKPLCFDFDASEAGWVDRIAREVSDAVRPVANTVLSPAYRKKMAGTLVKRIARKLAEENR